MFTSRSQHLFLVGVVLLASLCSSSESSEMDRPFSRSSRHHPNLTPQLSSSSTTSRSAEPALPHHMRHQRHRMRNGVNIDGPSRAKHAELAEGRSHLQLGSAEDSGKSAEDNTIVKERHPKPSTTECKGCAKNRLESQMNHDTFLQLMLEKEKLKILKKLGLTEPPVITGQLANEELPSPLSSGDMVIPHGEHAPDMDLEDFYAKTEQVIIFSESPTPNSNCHNKASACLNFQMPKEVVGEKIHVKVSTAELWVYKQPNLEAHQNRNMTFHVTEIFRSDTRNGYKTISVESRHNVGHNEGWETLNLTSTVESWMNRTLGLQRRSLNSQPLALQIECSNCTTLPGQSPVDVTESTNRPFLVINIAGTVQRKRKRRNIDCQPGLTECCRESFKVNFRQIGWGWITQPLEYDAYYCKGSCSGVNALTHSLDSHPTVVQKYLQYNANDNRTAELTPCCTAQKLSSISLVYQMDNKTLIHKAVSNMVVEACGCN